jgi:urease accessory protein
MIAYLAAMLLGSCPAVAHTGSGSGGFVGGFLHPVFGPDHLVAMVAVGLWGAFLGPPAIWLLPIVFPLVMAGGGVMESSACRCLASRSALPYRRSCSA